MAGTLSGTVSVIGGRGPTPEGSVADRNSEEFHNPKMRTLLGALAAFLVVIVHAAVAQQRALAAGSENGPLGIDVLAARNHGEQFCIILRYSTILTLYGPPFQNIFFAIGRLLNIRKINRSMQFLASVSAVKTELRLSSLTTTPRSERAKSRS